jgi:hypothetical protein
MIYVLESYMPDLENQVKKFLSSLGKSPQLSSCSQEVHNIMKKFGVKKDFFIQSVNHTSV